MDHHCKTLRETRKVIRHQRDNWELLSVHLNYASLLDKLKYCPYCGLDLSTTQMQMEL